MVCRTGYVIRHQGAPHLEGTFAEASRGESLMLDVIGFLLTVLAFASYVLYKATSFGRSSLRAER